MFGTVKHKVLIWSVIISGGLGFIACENQVDETTSEPIRNFRGNTQGTTYEIIIADNEVNFTNAEIDSVLAQFDASLSTYIPSSVISKLNASPEYLSIEDKTGFFETCYLKSVEIFQNTDGFFDVVRPLLLQVIANRLSRFTRTKSVKHLIE